jgi:2-dehydro-3-deoxyphosphooctonate aldolase (KDO 8-P synthase)
MQLFRKDVGGANPLFIIAGPCAAESEQLAVDVAGKLKEICKQLNLLYIFKASYDKANRSSVNSYRGPGQEEGLRILQAVKDQVNVPVITDVHEYTRLDEVVDVVDMLQTPAFLARQTDFITNVAVHGLPVNVKKGQFLSPPEMKNVVDKFHSTGNEQMFICERGFSFGYNNLVSDMRGLAIMRDFAPVVFDATHSVQAPGGLGNASGGNREFAPVLARAAAAVGVAGMFMETHPNPDKALSDGPNSLPLEHMEELLTTLVRIDYTTKSTSYIEERINDYTRD